MSERRRLIMAACIAVVAMSLAGCARHREAWALCARENPRTISLDQQIAGCTTMIHSANEPRHAVAAALTDRAAAYIKKKEAGRAVRDLNRAIGLYPDFALAFYDRGVVYYANGRVNAAFHDFDRAVHLNPDLTRALAYRGLMYVNKGEYGRGMKDLDRAIRVDPGFVRSFVFRGFAYLREGDNDRAMEDFDHAVHLKANFLPALLGRGAVYSQERRYERAIEAYDRVLRLKPDYEFVLASRGAAYLDVGEFTLAIKDFDRAVSLRPRDGNAFDDRGLAYLFRGEYRRGVEDFRRAIHLLPGNPMVFDNLCWAHGLADRALDAGMVDCNEALRLNPALTDAIDGRGLIYIRKGLYRKAIAGCGAILEHDRKSAGAFLVCGLARLRTGDILGGKKDIAAARALDPRMMVAYARYPGMPSTERNVRGGGKSQGPRAARDR